MCSPMGPMKVNSPGVDPSYAQQGMPHHMMGSGIVNPHQVPHLPHNYYFTILTRHNYYFTILARHSLTMAVSHRTSLLSRYTFRKFTTLLYTLFSSAF